MDENHNEKIILSWKENASAWSEAIKSGALESRRLVTNDAVEKAVLNCGGTRILDIGCGEGWLSRKMIERGKDVTGFDVSTELIEVASRERYGQFYICSYEQFIADPHRFGDGFDVAVCNFSLLGDRLDEMGKAIFGVTNSSGHLIIQTLHPYSSMGDFPYEDGWREETFAGLPGQWLPLPWYFRTMSSWIRGLTSAGWILNKIEEPIHPSTGKPASLILDAVKPS